MARGTWPNDPKSTIVGTGIDWRAASPLAFNAPKTVWKRVQQQDALRLTEDPKYRPIFKTLPDDIQALILGIATNADKKEQERQEAANRDTILKEIDDAIKEAEDADDIAAKLRGLELKARLHQLLNQKPVEDTVVTINVITGVERHG